MYASGANAATRAPRLRVFRRARQQKDARHDKDNAAEGQQRRALPEERYRRRGGEQGPGAARERVDQGEIPHSVTPLQEQKVPEVQNAAAGHEQKLGGPQARSLQDQYRDRERRVENDREGT